jgi:Arylsulfatase A and related enzymes
MKDKLLTSLLPGLILFTGCSTKKKEIAVLQINRPNVIYIYADDLGIGDLSCYGATKISTPNIDKLAGQGTQFTNAYASSATSTPSRFCLLTGKYPWRQENTGIARGNAGMIIDTATVTIADIFKKAGYKTGMVGKWHLGLGGPQGPDWNHEISPSPMDLGFDSEFLIPATVDRVPCVFVKNKHVVNLDPNDPIQVNYDKKVGNWPTGKENPELLKVHPSQGHDNTIVNGISRIGYMTGGKSALWIDEDIADVITNKAKDFIVDHKDEPFFLYFGTQDIHVPRVPNKRFAGKSGLGVRGDVILQLDWTVGEIMNTLDSLGIANNTIFIFTSDNGPVIDDGYKDEAFEKLNGHTPMGIYRGGKYSAYEAGTRVPFIVRWPAVVKPTKQQALFSQVDVFASLAAIIKQPLVKNVAPDSQNNLETFLGESSENREYIIQQNLNNTLAIIKGNWKYIEPSNASRLEKFTHMELGNEKFPQLYDLDTDPYEKDNEAEKHKDIVLELDAILRKEKNKK